MVMIRMSVLQVLTSVAVASLGAVSAMAQQPAPAEPSSASDEAKKIFSEAEAARGAKDFEKCVEHAERAYGLYPHVQIRGLQGMCELELGRFVDAATHLGFYVQNSTGTIPADATSAFDKAEARVVKLTVACQPEGVAVSIDGTARGEAPQTIYVEPGDRVIVVSKSDLGTKEERKLLVAGTKITVSFDLRRAEPAGTKLPVWPGIVGIAVGVAGIGVGAGFVAAAASADADTDDMRGLPCPARTQAGQCGELADTIDRRDAFHAGGIASLVAGGAILSFGIAWTIAAVSSGSTASDEARIDFVPLAGAVNGAALRISY